ncbi:MULTISPECIES: hypothetical protein [unclassified Streptomyces]|uniref:hypothetical protein n=1 Tax=unclassified Streptomyces TaxID=2593676 RepID=UPI003D7487CB
MSEQKNPREPSETALEEVMRELSEAAHRVTDPEDEPGRDGGEAGEAITPNVRAQEESQGDGGRP